MNTKGIAQSGERYIKFDNGLLIQWGLILGPSVNVENGLTLPIAYSSQGSWLLYAQVVSSDGDGYNYFATVSVTTASTGTVTTRGHSGTVNSKNCVWYAIGY